MNAMTLESIAMSEKSRPTRSVWRALFWKEWRQQRLAGLLIGLACLGLHTLWSRMNGWQVDGIALMAVFALACLSLGTQAFASETDDRTTDFLAGLPLPPWKLLLAKYLLAFGFGLLCLGACCLLAVPASVDRWLAGGSNTRLVGPLSQQRVLLLWGLLTAAAGSGMVALTAILARLGLGSMATWLTAGLLGAAMAATSTYGLWATGPQVSPYVALAVWAAIHLWLLRVWLRPVATFRLWRTACWVGAVLLMPAIVLLLAVTGERVLYEYSHPGLRDRLDQQACAFPSPDGHTVLLSTPKSFADHSQHSSTWLLDVDTGQSRRLGSRWRDSAVSSWCELPPAWAPDGNSVRTVAVPILAPWINSPRWRDKSVEYFHRMGGDGHARTERRTTSGPLSIWLKDGTRASWAPDAWEFTDPQSGELRRCLHSPKRNMDAYVRTSGAGSSVFEVSMQRRTKELAGWKVWRSAPELAEAQTIDVVVEEPRAEREYWRPQVSPDGRWLLFSDFYQRRLWLHSFADGSNCRLEGPDRSSGAPTLFTPDSSLLVVVGLEDLGIWNLAERRWQTAVAQSLHDTESSSISPTISPARPWRAAFFFSWGDPRMCVVSLEDGTVQEIFPKETRPRSFRWPHHVSWLGNDRLLVEGQYPDYQLWVVDADGTNPRQVLP